MWGKLGIACCCKWSPEGARVINLPPCASCCAVVKTPIGHTHTSPCMNSLCWLSMYLQHFPALKEKKKTPACCAYSSLIVQQHNDYNVDADTCIIPTETCKQAHVLPAALVHTGGLADAVLHVSGPQHTQHTPATACTHTHTHLQSCNSSSQAATTHPRLTAFICTDTYCLHTACYTHTDLSVSSKQPHLALSHIQWTCECTDAGLCALSFSVCKCKHTVLSWAPKTACYIHATPWIYTGNNCFPSIWFRSPNGLFSPKACCAFLMICNILKYSKHINLWSNINSSYKLCLRLCAEAYAQNTHANPPKRAL